MSCEKNLCKVATSRFDLEKFSLNVSGLSLVIRVNLLHPEPSLFLYVLLLSLVSKLLLSGFPQLKVILYVAKMFQNAVTGLLSSLH